jgi:hypothetical protein
MWCGQLLPASTPECPSVGRRQRGRTRVSADVRVVVDWIESEFAALRYFALNGTDHRSHAEQNAAIAVYVRWRNARAEPKTRFAPDSPIRLWTEYTHYPAKVA